MLAATSIDERDIRLTKLSGNTTKRKRWNTTESIKKKSQRITKNGEEGTSLSRLIVKGVKRQSLTMSRKNLPNKF